jgi:hypothetical protein
MSKRLIIVLALAFVLGIAYVAYAETQNVKVSGDITAYGISQNDFGLTKQGPRDKTGLATIARVRVDADLTDNVMVTVRLLNERYWGQEGVIYALNENDDDTFWGTDTTLDIDLAYVTLKEFMGKDSPLTLIIGRQELHYGNDMIIGDPDTNALANFYSSFGDVMFGNTALSARKGFDAIRAVLDYDPLVVDLVFAKIREGWDNSGVDPEHYALKQNDDINLYGINAAYKIDANTSAEAYWWTKRQQRKHWVDEFGENPKTSVVHTVGARIGNTTTKQDVDLTSSLEAAMQFGKFNDGSDDRVSSIGAYALEGAVTAGFKNVKYTPSATLLGALFSGKKHAEDYENPEDRMQGWDPMFENQKFGDIANQMMPQTNTRLIGVLASMIPTEDVILKGEYYAYWADRKYTDGADLSLLTGESVEVTGKRYLGSELDLSVIYNYTEDVQFGLLCGMYFPGSALHGDNDNTASELIGSMRVTF